MPYFVLVDTSFHFIMPLIRFQCCFHIIGILSMPYSLLDDKNCHLVAENCEFLLTLVSRDQGNLGCSD